MKVIEFRRFEAIPFAPLVEGGWILKRHRTRGWDYWEFLTVSDEEFVRASPHYAILELKEDGEYVELWYYSRWVVNGRRDKEIHAVHIKNLRIVKEVRMPLSIRLRAHPVIDAFLEGLPWKAYRRVPTWPTVTFTNSEVMSLFNSEREKVKYRIVIGRVSGRLKAYLFSESEVIGEWWIESASHERYKPLESVPPAVRSVIRKLPAREIEKIETFLMTAGYGDRYEFEVEV